jgi:hypothetical protein
MPLARTAKSYAALRFPRPVMAGVETVEKSFFKKRFQVVTDIQCCNFFVDEVST